MGSSSRSVRTLETAQSATTTEIGTSNDKLDDIITLLTEIKAQITSVLSAGSEEIRVVTITP